MTASRSPILVTGSHRAGTTWVGRMLCASREAGYVFEPFNVDSSASWLPEPLPHWFFYVCDENEAQHVDDIDRLVQLRYPLRRLGRSRDLATVRTTAKQLALSLDYRRRGVRPLLKDPIALFSTPWLARRFACTPVVVIRHPAAFVSSVRKLSWHFDFRNWTEQPLLMRDHLAPFADEIHEFAAEKKSLLEQGVLMWRVIYGVVRQFQIDHPGWIYVRHEDLADAPVDGFARLYERLDLRFDDRARNVVVAHSAAESAGEVSVADHNVVRRNSAAAGRTWQRRLSPEEVGFVRSRSADIAAHFYDEGSWTLAG